MTLQRLGILWTCHKFGFCWKLGWTWGNNDACQPPIVWVPGLVQVMRGMTTSGFKTIITDSRF